MAVDGPLVTTILGVLLLGGLVSSIVAVQGVFQGFTSQQGENRLMDAKENIDEFCEGNYAESTEFTISSPRNGELRIYTENSQPKIEGETTSSSGDTTQLGPEELNCTSITYSGNELTIPTENTYNLTKTNGIENSEIEMEVAE